MPDPATDVLFTATTPTFLRKWLHDAYAPALGEVADADLQNSVLNYGDSSASAEATYANLTHTARQLGGIARLAREVVHASAAR
jgi:hypothetical protein